MAAFTSAMQQRFRGSATGFRAASARSEILSLPVWACLPPLPLKFARAAHETSMPTEPSNDLKDNGFSKKANGHIGDGSTELHAAQAFGGSEPTPDLLILHCLQSQHQYSCICSSCSPSRCVATHFYMCESGRKIRRYFLQDLIGLPKLAVLAL